MAVEQFELGAAVESPTVVGRAWSNEVWRVATTTGVYCIKLFPACMPDHRRKQLADGLAFEQLVLTTGVVPIPRPIPVPATEGWLVSIETPAGQRLARCHEWVAGSAVTVPLRHQLLQAAG